LPEHLSESFLIKYVDILFPKPQCGSLHKNEQVKIWEAKMKTRIAMLSVFLILLSMFASAQQMQGNRVDTENALGLEDIPEDIASEAMDSEKCIEYLQGKFPRVDTSRLESICQKLRSKVDSEELKTMALERAQAMRQLSEDKRAALEELSQERKAFMEKFRTEELGKLNEMAKEEFKKAASLSRTQLKECLSGNETEAKECVAGFQIVRFQEKADMFRQRVVENAEAARNRFEALKNRHDEIKDDLKEERSAWQETVKSGSEDEQVEAGKKYFDKTAELIINNLEKIKSKVQESDDLTEEEVAEIVADIDEKIAEIEEAKEDMEAASTKQELKAAASEIVQRWKDMEHKVKLHLEYLGRAKVMDVMKRSEYLERRVENALVRLEEQGYDTSEIDALLGQFSEKVDGAREQFKEGNELLIKARNMAKANESKEQVKAAVEDGKELIKGAHEMLVDAHEISKEILAKIREMTGSIESVIEESEDDYVAVVEEEDDGEETESEDVESEEEESDDSEESEE
jgi:hypothetical protein